jgi:hypothetical protein
VPQPSPRVQTNPPQPKVGPPSRVPIGEQREIPLGDGGPSHAADESFLADKHVHTVQSEQLHRQERAARAQPPARIRPPATASAHAAATLVRNLAAPARNFTPARRRPRRRRLSTSARGHGGEDAAAWTARLASEPDNASACHATRERGSRPSSIRSALSMITASSAPLDLGLNHRYISVKPPRINRVAALTSRSARNSPASTP